MCRSRNNRFRQRAVFDLFAGGLPRGQQAPACETMFVLVTLVGPRPLRGSGRLPESQYMRARPARCSITISACNQRCDSDGPSSMVSGADARPTTSEPRLWESDLDRFCTGSLRALRIHRSVQVCRHRSPFEPVRSCLSERESVSVCAMGLSCGVRINVPLETAALMNAPEQLSARNEREYRCSRTDSRQSTSIPSRHRSIRLPGPATVR